MTDPVFKPGPAAGVPYRVKDRSSHPGEGASILMLHGWSGDESVMWVLESVLPGPHQFAALRGSIPLRGGGFQWAHGPASLEISMDGFSEAGAAVRATVDELAANGFDEERMIFMGFSQGAALSFTLAASGIVVPKAVIGLAGFVPKGELGLLAGLPVFWGHGSRDDLVPVERARQDVKRLQDAGVGVTFCEADVGHRLGIECTRGLKTWFGRLFDND